MVIGVLLKWMIGRSLFARFLTMFVVFYIFLGLPPLLYSTTVQGALSSLIVPVGFALSAISESEKRSARMERAGRCFLGCQTLCCSRSECS